MLTRADTPGRKYLMKCKDCSKVTTYNLYQPQHYKTNKITCAPSEDSDQPGHPPSLIKVFAVRSMGS